jgi:hypothetical protein
MGLAQGCPRVSAAARWSVHILEAPTCGVLDLLLDLKVIEEACRQYKSWCAKPLGGLPTYAIITARGKKTVLASPSGAVLQSSDITLAVLLSWRLQ